MSNAERIVHSRTHFRPRLTLVLVHFSQGLINTATSNFIFIIDCSCKPRRKIDIRPPSKAHDISRPSYLSHPNMNYAVRPTNREHTFRNQRMHGDMRRLAKRNFGRRNRIATPLGRK